METISTPISDTAELNFSDIDGAHLMKPFKAVRGSDQVRLLARLRELGIDSGDVDFTNIDLDKLADLIDYVADNFARDKDKFDEFTSGAGGMERAITLATAFAAEMGKGAA